MKEDKRVIFLRGCKEEDFAFLERVAADNNCSISRAFDIVMEAVRKAKIKITTEVKVTKK